MLNTLATKRELKSLSVAKAGDSVQFWYDGHGEHAHSYRTARVEEVYADGVLADDLTYGGVKHFKNRSACEVFLLESPHAGSLINFVDAQEKLKELGIINLAVANVLTSEQLTDLYSQYVAACPCEFNEETGEIVLMEESKGDEVVFEHLEDAIVVISRGNDSFTIEFNEGQVSVSDRGVWADNITPTQLAQDLSKFILDTE